MSKRDLAELERYEKMTLKEAAEAGLFDEERVVPKPPGKPSFSIPRMRRVIAELFREERKKPASRVR